MNETGELVLPVAHPCRCPAQVTRVPAIARLMLDAPAVKPAGAARLRRKVAKALFVLAYRVAGLSAEGRLTLALPSGDVAFRADFANTAYLDYARRTPYEPELTALIDAAAPGARVVYDIGANWGYFVAALATNPDFAGHVHAFEIAPATANDLRRMIAECGLAERATCHAIGLSDAQGSIRIAVGLHSYLTRVLGAHERGGREVPVARLDDLDLPDPDIVKIDVEGHEAAVLRGGLERLHRALPLVILESWYRPEMLEPLRLLAGLGYAFYRPRLAGSTLSLTPISEEGRARLKETVDIVALHPSHRRLPEGGVGRTP